MSRLAAGHLDSTLILLALSLACGYTVPVPDVVAEIDKETVSYQAFEDFLRRNSAQETGVLGSDVLSSLFDQFLSERLLERLAFDRQQIDPETDARSAIAALLSLEMVSPDENAIATHYQQNIALYDLPRRVYLRQFLFSDHPTASRIRDLWVRGTSYENLTEELAKTPSAHVGQEGEFSERELPSTFAETLFDLDEGEVSEVLAAEYGFHVFQVVRHLPAGTAPLAEVSAGIAEELSSRQSEEALRRLVTEARGRYNVRVFERNLPFNYQGTYGTDTTHANPV